MSETVITDVNIDEPSAQCSNATDSLQAQLTDAHRSKDADRLTELYADAADHEQARGNIDAMCFFLTQAYVHALQAGHPASDSLHARLARHGRI